MFNEFTLVDKRETSEGTYVLTYEPADDTPMTDAVAGQYVSIKVRLPEGIEQSRQFTLIPVDNPVSAAWPSSRTWTGRSRRS